VTIWVPVFLLSFLVAVVLVVRTLVMFAVRRPRKALASLKVLAGLLVVYVFALCLVGLFSRATSLPLGQPKCFDDWCFSVDKGSRSGDSVILSVATLNHGRRAQKPDSPHAFEILDGKTLPVEIPRLMDRIEGNSENPFSIQLNFPGNAKSLDFLVTEGGGPSAAIIGDENSPFHAKSSWNILP
jgi:hypothetical protein